MRDHSKKRSSDLRNVPTNKTQAHRIHGYGIIYLHLVNVYGKIIGIKYTIVPWIRLGFRKTLIYRASQKETPKSYLSANYCWWFRNPANKNTWDVVHPNHVNNGIKYLSLNWVDGLLPSIVGQNMQVIGLTCCNPQPIFCKINQSQHHRTSRALRRYLGIFSLWNIQNPQLSFTTLFYLVVSTHLKHISEIGSFPQVGVKITKYLKPHPVLIVKHTVHEFELKFKDMMTMPHTIHIQQEGPSSVLVLLQEDPTKHWPNQPYKRQTDISQKIASLGRPLMIFKMIFSSMLGRSKP